MKRVALVFPIVLVIVAMAALAAFSGRASAAIDPVPGWLAPSCSSVGEGPLDQISDDFWEHETDCSSDTTPIVVCIDRATLTIWTDDDPGDVSSGSDIGRMLADIQAHGHSAALGACASAPPPQNTPPREAYCSVAGNTNPFTGAPIAPGTFLDLLAGQPVTDKHYTGAVPAWWVQGVGLTCSLTPAQAALASASTQRVGAAGDPEIPIPGIPDYAIYTYVPGK